MLPGEWSGASAPVTQHDDNDGDSLLLQQPPRSLFMRGLQNSAHLSSCVHRVPELVQTTRAADGDEKATTMWSCCECLLCRTVVYAHVDDPKEESTRPQVVLLNRDSLSDESVLMAQVDYSHAFQIVLLSSAGCTPQHAAEEDPVTAVLERYGHVGRAVFKRLSDTVDNWVQSLAACSDSTFKKQQALLERDTLFLKVCHLGLHLEKTEARLPTTTNTLSDFDNRLSRPNNAMRLDHRPVSWELLRDREPQPRATTENVLYQQCEGRYSEDREEKIGSSNLRWMPEEDATQGYAPARPSDWEDDKTTERDPRGHQQLRHPRKTSAKMEVPKSGVPGTAAASCKYQQSQARSPSFLQDGIYTDLPECDDSDAIEEKDDDTDFDAAMHEEYDEDEIYWRGRSNAKPKRKAPLGRKGKRNSRSHISHHQQQASPPRAKDGVRACFQCGATKTPHWRRGPTDEEGEPAFLCNACGLRYYKTVHKSPSRKRTSSHKRKKELLDSNSDDHRSNQKKCTTTTTTEVVTDSDSEEESRFPQHTEKRRKLLTANGGTDKEEEETFDFVD